MGRKPKVTGNPLIFPNLDSYLDNGVWGGGGGGQRAVTVNDNVLEHSTVRAGPMW